MADRTGVDGDWRVPAPAYRRLRYLEVAALTVAAAAIVGAALGLGTGALGATAGAGGLAALGVVALIVVGRRARSWRYTERADDLLVERGVMVRRLSIIPYGRMQYVEVCAGPLERIFGLATVQMHTAAAASDARIPGLTGGEAARLRDQLTSLGESQAAGL